MFLVLKKWTASNMSKYNIYDRCAELGDMLGAYLLRLSAIDRVHHLCHLSWLYASHGRLNEY